MLKQAHWMAVVAASGLVGPAIADEPAKLAADQQALSMRILQVPDVIDGATRVQISNHMESIPDFTANFNLAARTSRPAPLAPGNAQVP